MTSKEAATLLYDTPRLPCMVTYNAYVNIVSDRRRKAGAEQWELSYTLLSEADAKVCATYWHNMKAARFEKLARHKSRKFTEMRTSRVWLVKIFHDQPTQPVSLTLQLDEKIKQQLSF